MLRDEEYKPTPPPPQPPSRRMLVGGEWKEKELFILTCKKIYAWKFQPLTLENMCREC